MLPPHWKEPKPRDTMTIELTDAELDRLTLALGMATGIASRDSPQLALSFMELANAVHKNNPNWMPYVGFKETRPRT